MKKVVEVGEVKAGDRIVHPCTTRVATVVEVTPTWGNSVVLKFDEAPRLILWRRGPATLEAP